MPAAALTVPVDGSSDSAPDEDDCGVSVTFVVAALKPPSRSLASTFATAVPPTVVTVAASSAASIVYGTAATVASGTMAMWNGPAVTGVSDPTAFVLTPAAATEDRRGITA